MWQHFASLSQTTKRISLLISWLHKVHCTYGISSCVTGKCKPNIPATMVMTSCLISSHTLSFHSRYVHMSTLLSLLLLLVLLLFSLSAIVTYPPFSCFSYWLIDFDLLNLVLLLLLTMLLFNSWVMTDNLTLLYGRNVNFCNSYGRIRQLTYIDIGLVLLLKLLLLLLTS